MELYEVYDYLYQFKEAPFDEIDNTLLFDHIERTVSMNKLTILKLDIPKLSPTARKVLTVLLLNPTLLWQFLEHVGEKLNAKSLSMFFRYQYGDNSVSARNLREIKKEVMSYFSSR